MYAVEEFLENLLPAQWLNQGHGYIESVEVGLIVYSKCFNQGHGYIESVDVGLIVYSKCFS
jgi:hypothetical protein